MTHFRRLAYSVCFLILLGESFGLTFATEAISSVTILTFSGTADVSRREGVWDPAHTNQVLLVGDKMRTGTKSRATIRLSDGTTMTVGAEASFAIPEGKKRVTLNPLKGLFYFFHRDKPGEFELRSKTAAAAVRGTEFELEADEDGTWLLNVIDGDVLLETEAGDLGLKTGEAALAKPGLKPQPVVMRQAADLIQWVFYYPAVLDVGELVLTAEEQESLKDSLVAYRAGNVPVALARCPFEQPARSDMEAIYRAALLLSVGEVSQAQKLLAGLSLNGEQAAPARSLRTALEELIAVVKAQPRVRQQTQEPETASEWLAESYRLQSESVLGEALAAAREAVGLSPEFGLGWERVAELEFSFGRVRAAREALEKAARISPRDARAQTLDGFLYAADNRLKEALQSFDAAIALDGAQGDAWLGRGLCRIRRGEVEAGKQDLLVAAALEPQRSVFRSYLGKAFANTGDAPHARKELELAQRLDSQDPTSWLYSALLNQQQNGINEAIRDLERSDELNNNRSVFRSEMLLDQDRAVRGANLASIYRDAGMNDVSVREATRAVNYDYANYSAHLFLANSYNELRDPQQINLRYETPWLSEYLIANLLAPVGAGTLSQTVSQQEYSKLFERDRFGVASSTEYLSRGDWVQAGSQYGNFGNFGYAVDTLYRSENGQRANNDQEQLTLSAQVKYDVTPQDSVFFQAIYYNASAGDLAQYYNQSDAHPGLRTKETQEPLLLAGYRHEWRPGVQTLVLAGRFDDDFTVTDTSQAVLLLAKDGAGQVIAVPTPSLPTASLDYRSRLEIYSAEVQQIFQQENHSVVVGARYQGGRFDTDSALGTSTPTQLASTVATTALSFASSPISQSARTDFERVSGYGYYYWHALEPLQLCAGLSYDYLSFPANHRSPPTSGAQDSEDQVSPKAGFTWTPGRDTAVRFAYTRSMGGVSFDQSVRLEPSQVAGFNQAFRSVIPEAVAGSTSGAKFETFGLSFEQKFKTGTYLGIEGQLLNSDVNRSIGTVDLLFPPAFVASSTRQNLDYQEQNLIVTLNQLLGDGWSLGARYQLSRAELKTAYLEIPDTVTSANHTKDDATLHQLSLFALFNHRSGFFARAEGNWYSQHNGGDQSALAGDEFWQVNLMAGYRFWGRRAQVHVGVLNLTDQDYRLNPLNHCRELPRARTFAASFQFNF